MSNNESNARTVVSDAEKVEFEHQSAVSDREIPQTEFDPVRYYEENVGSLVVDPEEARIEFGEKVASRLKFSEDGTKVLWPQPFDDPNDPQNWSNRRKSLHLLVLTMAAFVPDFQSAIGIPTIFGLATTFNTTTGEINNLTSNWSIFLLGWGSIFAVMVMRKLGRLPVLFWSQVLALGFMVGCTFSQNLSSFAAFRCLTAFFGTCPQVTGLFVIADMYPFHLQARMLNIWTMGFLVSPFVSPFLLGFMVGRTTWRWAYGVGTLYGAVVVFTIAFFMEETMYDRHLKTQPPRTTGLRYRIETLIGITGVRMSKYRQSWSSAIIAPFLIVWRPHLLMLLIFEGVMFGFSIGLNVTNVVFFGMPEPAGFGYSSDAIAGIYATPVVAVLIGEVFGRYANDWLMNQGIKRNKGIFEAETRLWAIYVGMPLYLTGFIVLGAAIEDKLTVGAIVMGWGLAEVAIMINTVAVYAYCNDCFPRYKGEISALINLARTLGGFAVAYFQVPWSESAGALTVTSVEAAIVCALFIMFVPLIQIKGRKLREHFGH